MLFWTLPPLGFELLSRKRDSELGLDSLQVTEIEFDYSLGLGMHVWGETERVGSRVIDAAIDISEIINIGKIRIIFDKLLIFVKFVKIDVLNSRKHSDLYYEFGLILV